MGPYTWEIGGVIREVGRVAGVERKSHFKILSPLLPGAASCPLSQGSSVRLTSATETKSVNVCEFFEHLSSSLSVSHFSSPSKCFLKYISF